MDYVVHKQHPDGHWNYSINEAGVERQQIDFHQGYILDCMKEVLALLDAKNDDYTLAIHRGMEFYHTAQFFKNGQAKWRLPKVYPVEIHNQSQGIISFSKEQKYEPFARTIALWTIKHMQHKKGFFYYRKYRMHTHKISYMRWSQAWMFVALTELVISNKKE